MTRKPISVLILILGTLAIFAPTLTRAASTAPTFTVNSPADVVASAPFDNGVCETAPGNGVCTLRAAIMKANHYPGGNATINFGLPGTVTYTLSIVPSGIDDELTGDLNITNTMTIIGNGAANTIIDGNGADRVFDVGIGITATISGITIKNGRSPCDSQNTGSGGGIRNQGGLTLVNSTVNGNGINCSSGSWGGGIFSNAVLTVTNSLVSGNTSDDGGGIFTNAVLTVANSIVSGNFAVIYGGGIETNGGELMLVNSTVSDNIASGYGGGLSVNGITAVTNSTVSGNVAGDNGGGIFNFGSIPLTLINSTVSSNMSGADGGGIYNAFSTTSLFNTTIADNLANADGSGGGAGGGVFNSATFSTVNFQNSIIGGNNRIIPMGILLSDDCFGTLTSQGNNILSSDLGCTISGGEVTVTDPMLGPLANNGGLTPTHALLPGSPAIDAGNVGGCTDNLGALLTSDQRGYPRPAFGKTSFRCDIGAFEYYRAALFLPLILK